MPIGITTVSLCFGLAHSLVTLMYHCAPGCASLGCRRCRRKAELIALRALLLQAEFRVAVAAEQEGSTSAASRGAGLVA